MQRTFAFAHSVLRVACEDAETLAFLDAAYGPLATTLAAPSHEAQLSARGLRFNAEPLAHCAMNDADPFVRRYRATQELFARFAAAIESHVALYAAAVSVGGRAALLLGETTIGKTTLALHLAMQGAQFLGDETVLLNEQRPAIRALPRRPMIRETALPMLPPSLRTRIPESPHVRQTAHGRLWYALEPQFLCDIEPSETERDLHSVIVLRRDAATAPRLRSIDGNSLLSACAQRVYGGARHLARVASLRSSLRGIAAFELTLGHPDRAARLILERLSA